MGQVFSDDRTGRADGPNDDGLRVHIFSLVSWAVISVSEDQKTLCRRW